MAFGGLLPFDALGGHLLRLVVSRALSMRTAPRVIALPSTAIFSLFLVSIPSLIAYARKCVSACDRFLSPYTSEVL